MKSMKQFYDMFEGVIQRGKQAQFLDSVTQEQLSIVLFTPKHAHMAAWSSKC